MTRESGDELDMDGTVKNGFDYNLQVWVEAGLVVKCDHRLPDSKGIPCCNAKKWAGWPVKDLPGHQVQSYTAEELERFERWVQGKPRGW